MNTRKPSTGTRRAPFLQTSSANDDVLDAIDIYLELRPQPQPRPVRNESDGELVDQCDDPVADFHKFGWGDYLHFAPRWQGQSVHESIVRHEHWLAHKLMLEGASRVLDVGCGVGGPMREIHRLTGCRITGIERDADRIRRAAELNDGAGLAPHCTLVKADFMAMPLPDAAMDAAYAIESTAHAPRLSEAYREIHRVLRPNGLFGTFEWCMTSRFDPADPEHQASKRQIEVSCGVPRLGGAGDVVRAMREAGFRILETEDRASKGDVPWWEPLSPSWRTPSSLRGSHVGARLTIAALRVLEPMHLVPRGTTMAARMLTLGSRALVAGGARGIFTPMFFVLAKKGRA